jgi:hypothetical protein
MDTPMVWLFTHEDDTVLGRTTKQNNIEAAITKALKLSVSEQVPFFVASDESETYVAVGRVGHVDAEKYPKCIGLAFESKFISAL